jgi:arylformamidase
VSRAPAARLVDLSHRITHGMTTHPGLPAPIICDYLSREASRGRYAPGVELQIGKIEMVANTGTYVDAPFHRYSDGADLADLRLESLAELDAVVIRADPTSRAVDRAALEGVAVGGRAVLIQTGWDRHWGTPRYLSSNPHLTAAAAEWLRREGAVLVGIDSVNIDNLEDLARPVHSTLLAAAIPIAEHLTGLGALPPSGFRFSAVPAKVAGFGTWPVRAYAAIATTGPGGAGA